MQGVFFDNLFDWMLFNLFLAFIPFVMSFMLFNKGVWEGNPVVRPFLFILVFVFFLFLPNAPYTLSDIIHLVRQIKEYRYFRLNDMFIITILIPEYIIFMFTGFSFYVLALQKFYSFLHEFEFKRNTINLLKLIIPIFMSVGIFLGRVHRYSTWDIVTHTPAMIGILAEEISNFSFYVYIFYFYSILVISYELFAVFYRSLFKKLFEYGG